MTNDEQRNVIHAMERLYARIHELRDAVQGNDWDDKLDGATVQAWAAMREFSASTANLA